MTDPKCGPTRASRSIPGSMTKLPATSRATASTTSGTSRRLRNQLTNAARARPEAGLRLSLRKSDALRQPDLIERRQAVGVPILRHLLKTFARWQGDLRIRPPARRIYDHF